jgi:hypothetical protein
VSLSCVVGVYDPVTGERPRAYITLVDDTCSEGEKEKLVQYLRDNVAGMWGGGRNIVGLCMFTWYRRFVVVVVAHMQC